MTLEIARSQWSAILGAPYIDYSDEGLQKQSKNLTEFRPRNLAAVLSPANTQELAEVLSIAQQNNVSVYPISTGCNWGVGSSLPVIDGCAVISLKRLNNIREVNTKLGYAVIEPGVTQRQLATRLKRENLPLVLNVTGSAAETSVLGNTLERGVGMRGQRSRALLGLEVMTADGSLLHTGSWKAVKEGGYPAHFYSAGLGPDLTGLFCQSNLGIVTGAVLALPKSQPFSLYKLDITDAMFSKVIDALALLAEAKILDHSIEITSYGDSRIQDLTQDKNNADWLIWFATTGSTRMRQAKNAEITEALSNYCVDLEKFNSEPTEPNLEGVRVRWKMFAGEPTDYNVGMMAKAYGGVVVGEPLAIDQTQSFPGMMLGLQALPFDGDAVRRVNEIVYTTSRNFGVTVECTYSSVDERCLEGFLRVYFDRTDERSCSVAHQWAESIDAALYQIGFLPYRLSVENMSMFTRAEFNHWRRTAELKYALDPHNIIAPGRYAPANLPGQGGNQ